MDSKNIYKLMLKKCPNNRKNKHYLKRYVRFIYNCKLNNKSLLNTYTERHHILPQSIWPEYKKIKDNKWNIVNITAKQHYISHLILAKAFGKGMWWALHRMAFTDGNHNYSRGLKSEKYDYIRKKFNSYMSSIHSGKNNPFYGKTHTKEARLKMGCRGKEHPLYGKTHTKEARLKMSNSHSKKTLTKEHKENISKSGKGKRLGNICINNGQQNKIVKPIKINEYLDKGWVIGKLKLQCPHCNGSFDKGNYTKHHGDKCKFKSKSELSILPI